MNTSIIIHHDDVGCPFSFEEDFIDGVVRVDISVEVYFEEQLARSLESADVDVERRRAEAEVNDAIVTKRIQCIKSKQHAKR